MSLPFSTEEFLSVFALYNNSIWPAQIVLTVLAYLAVTLCFRTKVPSALVVTLLSVFWIWTGIVYHIVFFSAINPIARLFGALFVLQGGIFFYEGVIKKGITFRFQSSPLGYTGALILAYGLIGYPILGYSLGHVYPYAPTFGAPCPMTIFTFGLLLWSTTRIRLFLLIIPCLWAIIGSTAALKLGIREDTGLLISGVVGTVLLALRKNPATTTDKERRFSDSPEHHQPTGAR